MLQVLKFGEGSFSTADAVRRAGALIKKAAPGVGVVVSASDATADDLSTALQRSLEGKEADANAAINAFAHSQRQLVQELISSQALSDRLTQAINEDERDLLAICQSIRILKELTQRTRDGVLAYGDRAMAQLLAGFLTDQSVATQPVAAPEVIHTHLRGGVLWPDLPRCEQAAAASVKPLLARKIIPVIGGGFGTGPDGEIAALGPGGSDLAATLLASLLGAESITLYKEVDGVMTADPNCVNKARVVPELHYREAAELAHYGSSTLHPRTLVPLMEAKISLFIKSLFNPDFSGTRVAADVQPGAYPVKAIAAFSGQALVSIEGGGMIGVPGMAARAFAALAGAGHSVSMISQASSESSICFVVPTNEAAHAVSALKLEFAADFRDHLMDSVNAKREVALIAVVGLGMSGRPGIASRIFSALSRHHINVMAIAQGSSELNITSVIDAKDVAAALDAIHSEYQLDRLRPLPDTVGKEAELVMLGFGQIGRALAHQLTSQQRHFQHDLGLNLKTIAVVDRSGVKLEEAGHSPEVLANLASTKALGSKSMNLSDSPTGWAISDPSKVLKKSIELMKQKIWSLPLHHPILADVTAEETAPFLLEALEHGFNVVLANKKPLAVPQPQFDRLMETARQQGLSIRYEATVGAGLPVLDTLAKLKEAGDEVVSVEGCLSGTLGYLMTQLEDGVPFAAAVAKAHSLGYTEPDPREDLSGMDVARKALILARTLGHKRELSDIGVEALFAPEVSHSDAYQFIRNLEQLNQSYAERQQRAQSSGQVLRYVAEISRDGIRVGLKAVSAESPMARLRGTDNQIVVYTKRYSVNPLVVTGPGAGAEVTAAGVLNDILAIAAGRDRRPSRKLQKLG